MKFIRRLPARVQKQASIRHLQAMSVIVAVAIVGATALTISRAATPTASLEPENGTLAGNVTSGNDTSASNGKYVKFGPNSSVIPNFSHIFEIVLENTSYSHIIGSSSAPYINSLVAKGGLATQFYGFTHFSLPNYFVLTAGQTSTSSYVLNDCASTTADCTQSYVSIPEEIEASGRTWKGYFQTMPSNCDTNSSWPYTVHLNPFVYYTRLISSGDCGRNVVPMTQFYTDMTNHTLPNLSWMAPDLCNDGHLQTASSGNCPNGGPYTNYPQAVGQADSWLSSNIPQIMASPEYQNNGLIVITWDEGDQGGTGGTAEDSSGCCGVANGGHIPTILLSPAITPGIQKATPETFYSILHTIEVAWSLQPLANEGGFNAMTEFF